MSSARPTAEQDDTMSTPIGGRNELIDRLEHGGFGRRRSSQITADDHEIARVVEPRIGSPRRHDAVHALDRIQAAHTDDEREISP